MKEKLIKDCKLCGKEKMRLEFLAIRNSLTQSQRLMASAKIMKKILASDDFIKAQNIMFYLSAGSEVYTDDMIKAALGMSKTVIVPVIVDAKNSIMAAAKINSLDDFFEKFWGIRQPVLTPENSIEKDEIDLVYVPAVCFDKQGFRLGYGKGFYDRWLKNVRAKTVGLAYSFQIVDEVMHDERDVPVCDVAADN
jgi:5-formyltetrahydrofolate cyclo-ligase